MVGLMVVGNSYGNLELQKKVSGAAVTANDPVTPKTNGRFQLSTVSEPIYGVALNTCTAAGQTLYVVVGKGLRVLASNDNIGTTFAATHVGAKFDLIGATGAVLVDTSTVTQAGTAADVGQVKCLEYNPQGYGYDTDTTVGLFEINEQY